MMWRALQVMMEKEFKQILRDTVISRMLFVMPLIQLAVLANAATFEVKRAALWVVDLDQTPVATAMVDRLTASGRFYIAGSGMSPAQGERSLLDGRATAVLTIPQGFARDIGTSGRSTVQLVLNAVNGSQAGVTQGYATQIIARYAAELGARGAGPQGQSPTARPSVRPMVEVRTRGWYNASLDYRRFMVPGILVQLITMIGTLMTALNIVREKEAGTLEQLNVAPLSPGTFIAGKLLPLWIISLGVFSAGLLIAVFGFDVPMEGSLLLLYAGAALFLVGALGVGLWISTIADTQQQALFVTFAVLMVYILMSGLFTPVRGMPEWVRTLAQANPLLQFIALTRAIMLRGAEAMDVWREFLALGLIGPTVLALAIRQSRKSVA
ncbi:MAG: ABC transporter permease [Gemmatimonadaceae bacterium]|jgi:ABC-2 type transport system permease protein|nr:ABC transporter permease [Gemmatimonadaceae bacterium]